MKGPNLSALGVRQPSVTLFLIIAISIAGLTAFFKLGRAEDPTFTIKIMTISATWPGATAKEMQDFVADPIEKRLQELRYYDRVDTQSRPGSVTMTVWLLDSTPPSAVPDEFYQVRKKISDEAANLPRGVSGPFFNDEYSDGFFSLYALQADGLPGRDLVTIAEGLRTQMLSISGVKKVKLIGEQRPRIFIEVSYRRLATLGIVPDQLLAAISNQNLVTPGGAIQTPGQSVSIRVDGAFQDLDTIRATAVAVGGRVLRLGDIAEVHRGYEDPATYVIRHEGKPAVMLGVVMRERFNGITLGASLAAQTATMRQTLPLGATLTQVSDQAGNIKSSYQEFMIKFAVALAVVLIVSLLTLGLRVGIIVAAAVPLTLAAGFVIMLVTGRDFDRITLGALILSLGLLVDDAIIAIEMMVVKMEEGLDRMAAATFAWGATASPMLAGTLVTVIGFLPVGFAESSAGEYAGNIFWIVAFSLLISWLVAVYITPYLGVHLLPAIPPRAGGHDAIYSTPRYARLRALIDWCVSHRRRVALVTFGGLGIAAVLLVVAVPKQFFPSTDRGELIVEAKLPKGSTIEATGAVTAQIEKDLKESPQAALIDSYIGAGAPRFYLALNPELPDPSFAKIVIQTSGEKARDQLRQFMEKKIAAGAYPSASVRVTQLVFGPPSAYPVTFRVSGPDAQQVRAIATKVANLSRANSGTRNVNVDWGERAPALRLTFDEDRLRLLGFDPTTVARQVGTLLSGVTVSQVRTGDRTADMVVRAPATERRALEHIGDLVLSNNQGANVPLSGVARLVPTFEDPLLIRRNRSPTISVRADIVSGLQPPDVSNEIFKTINHELLPLPSAYAIDVGGDAEQSSKANDALAPIFPVMVGMMLLVIMFQTRSFRMTGLTFATAPLGLLGAIPALLITGKPFGFTAILGLIGLAGILMRNTLILVDQIEAETRRGLDARAAVIEATVRRSRPVLLTAVAAILAFIPLTLSTFWGPLALVLIGGTIVGTALTLFFLPALYALFFRVPLQATATTYEGHGSAGASPAAMHA